LQADATIADLPLDPLLGRVFEGKYRLDERLGGGGMGTVYRATHLLIDRAVALKVLSQRFVGDQTAQQRFRREARAAGRIQHPNAVTVTDFGATEDGYLYIVMELLEGRTLRDLLALEGPLDPARAVSIMLQACAAVGSAHEAGLIHRDLKPANIFIEQRPNFPAVTKVLDFGVAKFAVEEHDDDYKTLTQVGAIIGTPRYMSPEQCSGAAPLTPASDVYSLGIILYEMLAGVVPFTADTPLGVALKQVSEAPPAMKDAGVLVPPQLERLVLHALAKNPFERPRDGNQLRQEIHEAAEALGLEHAESIYAPSLEALRNAGTESPSGRLVIDLATLRQVQAASVKAKPLRPPEVAAAMTAKPDFDRLNVPLVPPELTRKRLIIIGAILVIAILGSGVLAARWWRGDNGASSSMVNANSNVASPTATPTATPSPSPSPKPVQKAAPEKEKKRSKLRRLFDKIF
jgi:serine/threonine-protein kinase